MQGLVSHLGQSLEDKHAKASRDNESLAYELSEKTKDSIKNWASDHMGYFDKESGYTMSMFPELE